MGGDRIKRKYTQMSDGKVNVENYHVKRPKASSEYQNQMGAIDAHNYRRQSCKSVTSFEKVCITRKNKDRVFINIVSWILINIFLLHKYFMWGGEEKCTPAELRESIAMALINNQHLSEVARGLGESSGDGLHENDPNDCQQHPNYKKNLCRHCYKHKTIYICRVCSNPKRPKARKDQGPKGGAKVTHGGYMHFCKHNGCFAKHKCGHVPWRRPKASMRRAAAI